jgi:hypothetical protein
MGKKGNGGCERTNVFWTSAHPGEIRAAHYKCRASARKRVALINEALVAASSLELYIIQSIEE